MADRAQVKEDLTELLRSLSRRNASTIHLIRSWYGAGKTHTLRHMEYLCERQYKGMLPVYTEIPKGLRSFGDIYKAFANALDFDVIRDCFLEVATSPLKDQAEKELRASSLDMFNALGTLCMGTDRQQEVVLRWLRGEAVSVTELRPLGIGKRLSAAEDAIKAVAWLVRLILEAAIEQGTHV